ncbi:MAG: hypothetical protein B7733_23520 [Myxococcales bacterium FL481]|nr:MAG: hypothetical protein B7733_23520 [Myxococcales bacterium FL481]
MKRKLPTVMLITGIALLAPQAAHAFAPAPQDADEAAFKGEQGGATVYDFEDDNVDGEILRPEGALINSRAGTRHASLITLRRHFIPELIRMAEDI